MLQLWALNIGLLLGGVISVQHHPFRSWRRPFHQEATRKAAPTCQASSFRLRLMMIIKKEELALDEWSLYD
jgi:hypothetical protein